METLRMPTRRCIMLAVALVIGAGITGRSATAAAPPKRAPNLLDVTLLVNRLTDEFSTLIAAVQAADPAVLEALSGTDPLTVYAPTDAAFARLGLDADSIGSLPQETLTEILLYHVTPGRYPAARLLVTSRVTQANGDTAQISIRYLGRFFFRYGLFLNDSLVLIPDIRASNGIIHVIDSVLLPPAAP